MHTDSIRRWILLATSVTALAVLPFIGLSKELFKVLTGPDFWDAYRVTAFLLVLPAISGLLGYYNTIVASEGRTRLLAAVTGSIALAFVPPLVFVAPWGGLIGVVLVLIVGDIIWLGALLVLAQRHLRYTMRDYAFLGSLIAVTFAVAVAAVYGWPDSLSARLLVVAVGATGIGVGDWLHGGELRRYALCCSHPAGPTPVGQKG